jgi:putative addiction module component (TIGR02574 family)
MDTTIELRKRVQNYIKAADDRLLRLIEALVVSYQEDVTEEKLTDVQKKELDRRLQRYNEGKTVFHTWEEVEAKLDRL